MKGATLMRDLLKLGSRISILTGAVIRTTVVGHAAKVAGKESYKTAKFSVKATGYAAKAFVKLLF
jgi:hypothetical protein